MKSSISKINYILGSRRFFLFVLIFFVFEATWIALSARYPQAFDEDFHFGLIQTYSHYWLPFLSSQPPHANAYGAVARDPSYLYHYLMSFPYRLINLFYHEKVGQVILLRFINVGFFAGALVLIRRVMLRVGGSPQLTNVSLLLFVLIPVAPQMAAQINYDNLLIPLVAWTCLLTFQAIDELRHHHPSARTLLTLLSVCLLSSLVKYEFMPIFLGVVLFLLFVAHKSFRGKLYLLWARLKESWVQQSRRLKTLLIIATLISAGMFVQRDGINLIKYHTISPDCSTVLSIKDCSAYSVWDHDYTSHQKVISNATKVNSNPLYYLSQWAYWLWYRLFFAINGPTNDFTNYPPLPLPSAAFIIIGVAGIAAVIKWHRRVFNKNPYLMFLTLITVLYLIALVTEGYLKYEYTDVLELMNGRYLLPILPLAAAIIGSAFSVGLRKTPRLKAALAVCAIALFLQGGGFLTFIARSDSTWDWQNNTVVKVNNAARHISKPVLIKGKKTYATPMWFFN
jgi:hypothetical protein